MFKGIHVTSGYNPDLLLALNLKRILVTSPLQHNLMARDYAGLDKLGVPIVRHVFDMRKVITLDQARSLQDMPNGAEWHMMNEPDLPWGTSVPAQTPKEAATMLVRNMEVVMCVASADAKFILSAGSQLAIETGWFVEMVSELRVLSSDILSLFSIVGVHYYEVLAHESAERAIKWLRNRARAAMNEAGLDDLDMWVTEIGLPASRFTRRDAEQYVPALFASLRKKQSFGQYQYVKAIVWFPFNNWKLGRYRILSYPGRLTMAGRAFAEG